MSANINWNPVILLIVVFIFVLIIIIVFREQIKLLIRRTLNINYHEKAGNKERTLKIIAEPENKLLENKGFTNTEAQESYTQHKNTGIPSNKMPQRLYSDFIGRQQEMGEIIKMLEMQRTYPIIAIHGMGGLGKTALVFEIVRKVVLSDQKIFTSVYWLTAKRRSLDASETIVNSKIKLDYAYFLSDLGNWLGVGREIAKKSIKEKEKLISEILNDYSCLLILDNMETFDDEQDLLAAKLRTILGKSKAIMTSRVKWKPTNGLHQIALESLPIQDAVSLMRSFAAECGIHRVSTASNNDLISIAEQVGRLPLALRLATGQLLLQDLDSIQTSINQISSSFTEELFDYLFKSSINILNKHEKDLLIAVAQFDEATGADSNTLREMAVVEGTVFDDAISKIVRLSLVEVGGDLKNTRYFLHALAYTYVKQKLEGMRL